VRVEVGQRLGLMHMDTTGAKVGLCQVAEPERVWILGHGPPLKPESSR
jgi:hypothetical protein